MMPLHQSLAKDYEAIAQIVITLQFSFWALFLHLYEPISL